MKAIKKGILHPRNRHQGRYDFQQLKLLHPELVQYLGLNHHQEETIDFSVPEAVKALNRALLKQYYGIIHWDIPTDYLCPPIPGRADYIHFLADLLAEQNGGVVPRGPQVRVLDIGVGANCIYPILGHLEYHWSFVGADIDRVAIQSAKKMVEANPSLHGSIEIRLQDTKHIFKNMIQKGEFFDLTLCNPPFHASAEEANEVNRRKWRNLGKAAVANFGGQNHELWCEGGEVAFVSQMIEESAEMPKSCFYFSSFVSKEASLSPIYDLLRKMKVTKWQTIEMAQGQKKSRFVAWTFLTPPEQEAWKKARW